MTDHLSTFAACFAALYAGHHVADYWVQTDHQARRKGDAGREGAAQCLLHCINLITTQAACLLLLLPLGFHFGLTTALGLLLSGGSHYLADRREHGLMFRLARLLPGKANFLELGQPRGLKVSVPSQWHDDEDMNVALDNPSLGTGAWALDQAWHIFFGVFLAALVIAL